MDQNYVADTLSCANCGAQVPSGAGFCPACGTAAPAPTASTPDERTYWQEPPAQSDDGWTSQSRQAPIASDPAANGRSRRGLLVVLGAIALVGILVAGGLAAYAILPHHSGTPTTILYRLAPSGGRVVTASDLDTTVSVLRARLAARGADGTVTKIQPDEVSVQVYDLAGQAGLRAFLAAPGQLEFVLLPRDSYGFMTTTDGPTAGVLPLPSVGSKIDSTLPVQFSGADIDPSSVATNPYLGDASRWEVDFNLQAQVAGRFSEFTTEHVNEYFAIVMDGEVIEVPYIAQAITNGGVSIGGVQTQAKAKEMADTLRAGQLPYPLSEVSESGAPPPTSH
jgi:hypothetical protein